jgi:hypothetical protein
MARRSGTRRAAREVRFGRLDIASRRVDRERAAAALAAYSREREVVWAGGLVEAVGRVAGGAGSLPIGFDGRVDNVWRLGGGPSARRLERVADFDEAILRAARHAVASGVPAEERLAFRASIPRATLVSSLAVAALRNRLRGSDTEALAFAGELSRAGVLAVWFLDDRLVVVPRPDVSVVADRLHAAGRPAVRWLEESLWFWQGVWIPAALAERRDQLRLADVLAERNVERRRLLIEMIGFEKLARQASDGPAQEDDYGRLWRLGRLVDDEEYVAVEVVNSTPEADGSFRRYFLRVPPGTRTARAGVAWSFELPVRDYVLAAQS